MNNPAPGTDTSSRIRLRALRLTLVALALPVACYAWNGVLPHQLSGAPFFSISIDNTFWLFHFSGLAGWLHTHPPVLTGLEVLFVVVAVTLFWTGRAALAVVLLVLTVLLSLYLQTWSCTLTKISVALPIVLLPFCFPGPAFPLAWKIPRYYLAYVMVSAGIFKLVNGGLFHPGQLENILYNQHLDLLLSGSHHFSARWAQGLVNSHLATAAYIAITALEISFVTLLFTRKTDALFTFLLLFFCVAIWAVMRIQTLELVVLAVPLAVRSLQNPYLAPGRAGA